MTSGPSPLRVFLAEDSLPVRQRVDAMPPKVWVRVREKADEGARVIGYVCPNCVARLFLQVTRLGLWKQVSGQLMASIRRAVDSAMGKTKASRRLRG